MVWDFPVFSCGMFFLNHLLLSKAGTLQILQLFTDNATVTTIGLGQGHTHSCFCCFGFILQLV